MHKYSLNAKSDLRYDIYFALSIKQRRKLNSLINMQLLENINIIDFYKVTKNKELIDKLILLKRSCLRLVA